MSNINDLPSQTTIVSSIGQATTPSLTSIISVGVPSPSESRSVSSQIFPSVTPSSAEAFPSDALCTKSTNLSESSASFENKVTFLPESFVDESFSPEYLTSARKPDKISFKSLFNWYWPTSIVKGEESEANLLAKGNIIIQSYVNKLKILKENVLKHAKKKSISSVVANSSNSHSADLIGFEESQNVLPNANAVVQDIFVGPDKFIHTLIVDATENKDNSDGLLSKSSVTSTSFSKNIVFCHGFGAGLAFFYKNYLPLSQRTKSRIYSFDWLGMGRSSRPTFPKYDPDPKWQHNEALDFFIHSLEKWRHSQKNLDRFTLIGHSLGGYLATIYALKYPQHVEKLILLSPVGLPSYPSHLDIKNLSITGDTLPSWLSNMWTKNYTPQWLIRTLGPLGPQLVKRYTDVRFKYLPKEELSFLKDYLYHISASNGSGEYALNALLQPGAWARDPLVPRLKDLKMPTIFFYGEHDWMDYRCAQEMLTSMKKSDKLIQISNAGHHLYLDNIEEFNEKLSEIILE